MNKVPLSQALRELIESTDKRDEAERLLTLARQSGDSRLPLKPITEAMDEAKAFLVANLQHGAALAQARNVLAAHDDACESCGLPMCTGVCGGY